MCGSQTECFDYLMDHVYNKAKAGYTKVQIVYNKEGCFQQHIRSLDFCPSCSKKSYTLEELKTIGNYNQWSY